MNKYISKISSVVLYAILGITAIITVLFYFGGKDTEAGSVSGMLVWMYCLLALTSAALIGFSIKKFMQIFKENPRTFRRNLIVFFGILFLLVAAWISGNGETLIIRGYTGSGNSYFWLKITDMLLYSIYILLGLVILSVFVNNIREMMKK